MLLGSHAALEIDPAAASPRPGSSWAGLVEWQLLRDRGKQFPDVLGGFCRRLKVQEAGFPCIRLRLGSFDGPLRGEVQLVSGQSYDDVLVCLAL